MLGAGWRPSKVAAWVVAARRDRAFTPALVAELKRAPGYAEHLCIALAALASTETAEGLAGYIRTLLPPAGSVPAVDETVSPDWALAALFQIDAQLGSAHAFEFIRSTGPWDRFVTSRAETGPGASPALAKRWEARLAAAKSALPEALRLLRSHLS